MAVVTYTRRQIVDMIPEFLTKVNASFAPQGKALSAEAGISEAALLQLNAGFRMREGDAVPRAIFDLRAPYATKRPAVERGWAELAAAGLAETTPDGWRITESGAELATTIARRVLDHMSSYSLPAEPLHRTLESFVRLAARIPPDARRAALAARVAIPGGPVADIVRLSRVVGKLWGFRDDCHIAAWEAAGYDGPTLDVLTQAWSAPTDMTWSAQGGKRTVDEIVNAIGAKQEANEVEARIDALVARGDLVRDGGSVRITEQGQRSRDAIEAETDRRFFAVWDLDDDATARLGDDLRAVIDSLPK